MPKTKPGPLVPMTIQVTKRTRQRVRQLSATSGLKIYAVVEMLITAGLDLREQTEAAKGAA